MKAVELFCGIGLSGVGLFNSGFHIQNAHDMDPRMVAGWNATGLPPVATLSDVAEALMHPSVELICAGPTCKAFSPGASLFGTSGQYDERNAFPALMKYIRRGLPKHIMIENTFGLQRFHGYMGELLRELAHLGYRVEHKEINCFDYGIAQNRRRLVFLCSRGPRGWYFPTSELDEFGPGDRVVRDCMLPVHDNLLEDWSEAALAYWRRDRRHEQKHPPLQLDRPSSTVFANYKRGMPYGVIEVAPGELKRVGTRLAARLQGLPEWFLLPSAKTHAYEGIGNGFPPCVVQKLLTTIPA